MLRPFTAHYYKDSNTGESPVVNYVLRIMGDEKSDIKEQSAVFDMRYKMKRIKSRGVLYDHHFDTISRDIQIYIAECGNLILAYSFCKSRWEICYLDMFNGDPEKHRDNLRMMCKRFYSI